MKVYISQMIIIIFNISIYAQNLGINTGTPIAAVHAMAYGANSALWENQLPLNNTIENSMYFAYALQGPGTYKWAGAIKTIGSSTDEARLGLFTYASPTQAGLVERLTISDGGNVGIGIISPEYLLDVNGYSRFENVGILTPPTSSYSLTVAGAARMYNNLRIDGIMNPDNPLAIGNNTTIEGSLTVNNGKGIVRSTNSTQMKIKRTSGFFNGNSVGAGVTITTGLLFFGEDFAAVSVMVGQVFNGTGDFQKVLVVPFNVDLTANTCQFHLTNVSSSAITFTGTWEFVLIGN